jgi:hypothetical protein
MTTNNFQFSFTSSKNENEVFSLLLNVKKWWNGLFGEDIKGKYEKIGDEFTFKAGDGVHYSNQKLIELIPYQRIVWLVTESNLSFLNNTNEWANTKICFDMEKRGNSIHIIFTHMGLIPEIECYDQCTNAWTQYLQKLAIRLK